MREIIRKKKRVYLKNYDYVTLSLLF